MAKEIESKFRLVGENATGAAFREVQRGFGDIERSAQRLRGVLSSLGVGLSVAGLTAFVRSGIQAADELNKLSQRVGVTVESLSALNFAAELSDVSVEQLSTGLRQLARNAFDAQAGTGEAKDAFKALGIEVTDTAGQLRGTEALLLDVAERFAGIEDGAGKTALAMKLFGRSGAELIPLLNQGRDGFEQLRAEAERLGIVVSGETAAAAEQFNDNLLRLTKSADGLKVSLTRDILPTLNAFADILLDVTQGADDADESFSVINETLKSMGTGVLVVASAFKALGRDIGAAAAAANLAIQGDFSGALEALKARGEDQVGELEQLANRIRRIQGELFGEPGARTPRERRAAPALPDDPKKTRAAADTRAADAAKLAEFELRTLLEAQEAFNNMLKGTAAQSVETSRRLESLVGDTPIAKTRALLDNVQFLDEAFFAGKISAEEWQQAVENLTGTSAALTSEVENQKDAARELGLTFSSAFEDAVVGGKKAIEVVKALGDDLLRIAARKLVTEPLANAASGFFGSLFSGIFGAAKGGIMPGGFQAFASGGIVRRPTLGLVGEGGQNEAVIPLPDGQNVPVKLQGGGGATVNQVFHIDARGAAPGVGAEIRAALAQVKKETIAAVVDLNRRGQFQPV